MAQWSPALQTFLKCAEQETDAAEPWLKYIGNKAGDRFATRLAIEGRLNQRLKSLLEYRGLESE